MPLDDDDCNFEPVVMSSRKGLSKATTQAVPIAKQPVSRAKQTVPDPKQRVPHAKQTVPDANQTVPGAKKQRVPGAKKPVVPRAKTKAVPDAMKQDAVPRAKKRPTKAGSSAAKRTKTIASTVRGAPDN